MILSNKEKATAISMLLILTMAISFIYLPDTTAHTPAWAIPTYAYIVASPNPVGVGQTASIIMWLDKAMPGAELGNDFRFHDFKLTITKPNNTTETKTWDVVTDTTSSQAYLFTPDQTGTYTFKFEYPGQTYTWTDLMPSYYGPPTPNEYTNDTYIASNAQTTLTVQEEPLSEQPSYPLPTEYWARPIEGQNTAWTIASNWLGSPFFWTMGRNFQPNGAAPNSPHIMWTKPLEFGGVVGGNYTIDGIPYYSGLAYEGKYINPIIMQGRLYYDLPRTNDATGGGYVCVDLLTGKTIYWQNLTQPPFGQLYDYESPNQHGVIPNGYLWSMSGAWTTAGTWTAYDPIDGSWLFDITNVPDGTMVYGTKGEALIYGLANDAVGSLRLLVWNNTAVTDLAGGAQGTSGGMQWRANGKIADGSTGYSWNSTIPSLPESGYPTILKVIPGDMIIGTSSTFAGMIPDFGTPNPYTLWAISDKTQSRGTLLWSKSYSAPDGNKTIGIGPVSETARVIALNVRETMQYYGISIDTGNIVWGPTTSESALDYYQKLGINEVCGAYGNLYTASYGGVLRCYSMKTGTLLWSYNNTVSGLATPWPNYPLGIGAIADGKVYAFTSEHSPNAPQYRGARVRAINATTGEEMWTMQSWMSGFQSAAAACAVADGYFTYLNTYDMQIYTIGKGASRLTVEAPMTSNEIGKSLIIRGTVTDIAAGTTQNEQAARFPNGVPAVSDASMSEWMEYVYMQKPCPTNTTGVPVTLSVIDANGNYRTIGQTNSDALGFYSYAWQPDISGKYTVIATFAGSGSYYPSSAETAFVVDSAAEATATPTPQPQSMADLYFLPLSIGTILAVIVIGAVLTLLLLKKRP